MNPDDVDMTVGEDAQPPDRLTRIANAGRKAMEACPEWGDDIKLIISVHGTREDGRDGGGMFVHGYEPDEKDKKKLEAVPEELREAMTKKVLAADVVAVLMEHASALLTQVTGTPVRLVPVSGMTPVNLTTPN